MKLALRGRGVGRRRVGGAVPRWPRTPWNGRGSRPSRSSARACCWPRRSLASVYYFLVRPLRRRVTDEQVALYLEEHEPSLQATLVSAVEASREGADPESAVLIRRLVEQALEACASTNAARRVEEEPLRRWGVALAGLAVAAALIVLLGPAFVRNALSAILLVQRSVEAAAPYRIEVQPGNANVPEGRGPDDHRDARRVRRRGRLADGQRDADRRVRGAAARARRGRPLRRASCSTSARRSSTSSRPTTSARRSTS